MIISVLVIATGKYKEFVQQLLNGIDWYFMLNYKIEINLFTDKFREWKESDRMRIIQHIIPPYKFPEATLLRYKIFKTIPIEKYGNYIFYLDADMSIVNVVGDEILGDITAVLHPGYYNKGWGDEGTVEQSKAYIPKQERGKYCAGGFQGGKTSIYYRAIEKMAEDIEEDRKEGIMAEWHDESHWNWYLHTTNEKITILSPSYCMPEALWKRKLWGVNQFEPKILALEKEEDIRE